MMNDRHQPSLLSCLTDLRAVAILLGFVWLCAFTLTACDNTPPLPRLSEDAVILAFGDSLTFGTGADHAQSYPAVLQQLTGRQVINAGVPGEISAKGLKRLPGLLKRYQPKLLVLCHGGNDILRRMSRSGMKQNLDSMIRLAKQQGIAVALLAVPEFGLFLQPAEVYAELAAHHDIPVELDALSAVLQQPSLKSDQVHPNRDGYRHLAQAVAALLKKSGAI